MIVTGFVIAIGSLLTSSGATVGGPTPFWDLAVTEATADDAEADHGSSADMTALTLDTSVRSRSETCPPGSKPAGSGCIDKHPVHIAACSAKRAVKFYAGRIAYWRSKMGDAPGGAGMRRIGEVGRNGPTATRDGSPSPCPRYLAHVLQRKAYALRKAYARYVEYQYAWWKWLPDKFARVGACETGYGKKPGSWTWDSGTYVSAFGIYRPAYEAYHRWTGHNTPREQYEVAAAIQARFGWGAWGCGGA